MGDYNSKYVHKKDRSARQKASLAAARARAVAAKPHTPQTTKENMPVAPSRIQPRRMISLSPMVALPRLFSVRKFASAGQGPRARPSHPTSLIPAGSHSPQVSFPAKRNPFIVIEGRDQAQQARLALWRSFTSPSSKSAKELPICPIPSSPITPTRTGHFPWHCSSLVRAHAQESDPKQEATQQHTRYSTASPVHQKRAADIDSSLLRATAELKRLQSGAIAQRRVVDKTRNRLSRASKKIDKLETNLNVIHEQLSTETLEHSTVHSALQKAKQNAEKRAERAKRKLEVSKIGVGAIRAKLRAAKVYNERHAAIMGELIESSMLDLQVVNLLENGKWSEPQQAVIPMYL